MLRSYFQETKSNSRTKGLICDTFCLIRVYSEYKLQLQIRDTFALLVIHACMFDIIALYR